MYVTIFYLIYIHHYPRFTERLTLAAETFNESVFLVMCYHMVLFSNLIWDPNMKKQIGVSLIFCVFTLLGVNTLIIATVSIKQIIRNKKINKLKKTQTEHIRQRNIALHVISNAVGLNYNFYKLQRPSQYEASLRVFDEERVALGKRLEKRLARLLI